MFTVQATGHDFQHGSNFGVSLDPSFWLWWYYWMLFTWLCNVRHPFLSVSHLVFHFVHNILLRHCPWRNFWNLPLLGDPLSRVSPIHRESSLRTLRNAHFRREEVPHDEGQLFAMYSKKLSQVSLIDRAPQLHFSTLEKTKIDHNPLVNNLILTFPQVSPFYRH